MLRNVNYRCFFYSNFAGCLIALWISSSTRFLHSQLSAHALSAIVGGNISNTTTPKCSLAVVQLIRRAVKTRTDYTVKQRSLCWFTVMCTAHPRHAEQLTKQKCVLRTVCSDNGQGWHFNPGCLQACLALWVIGSSAAGGFFFWHSCTR